MILFANINLYNLISKKIFARIQCYTWDNTIPLKGLDCTKDMSIARFNVMVKSKFHYMHILCIFK